MNEMKRTGSPTDGMPNSHTMPMKRDKRRSRNYQEK